jgi:hypothetical protein
LIGDDGKINKANFDRLPDTIKKHVDVFKKYDTVEALLNGFGNAHDMGVKKALAPLGPDATAEMRAERKAHLDTINNVPKDAKDYGIAMPKDFPKEFWDQALADNAMAIAHKYSLPREAIAELVALQGGSTLKQLEQAKANQATFFNAQNTEFDAEVAKLGITKEEADTAVKTGAATLGIKPDSPRLKMADVRLACLTMTKLVSESRLKTGSGSEGQAGTERDEARKIMGDPTHPLNKAWNDQNDPRHEEARARVDALYRAYKPPAG